MTAAAMPPAFELRRFLPARLAILSSRLARSAERPYANRFKLSAPEWRVVAVLGQQGAMSAEAVIAQTTMDKVRVSRAVGKLLKSGVVSREADPEDRRRAILGLTVSGRDVYRQIVPLIQDAETAMMAALTKAERDALAGALGKIEGYLERTGVAIDPETDAKSDEP